MGSRFTVRVDSLGFKVAGLGFRIQDEGEGLNCFLGRFIGQVQKSLPRMKTFLKKSGEIDSNVDLSHRMYLSISFRTSTPRQTHQLIYYYYKLKQ